jgi:hypothetical protein
VTTAAIVAALLGVAMSAVLAWSASGMAAAVVPNPPAQATVGLDVAVVIDASSSLGDVGMQSTKDAVDRLLLPLVDTGSWVSVTSFAQGSPGVGGTNVAPTLLTTQALPAVRAGYADLRAAGGTSWQAGLAAAEVSFAGFGQGRPDLLFFVTDGAPNTVDGVFLPPASTRPLDAAVAVADRIKAGGTRIFGVAVRTADIPIEAISGDVAYAGSDVGSADFARIDDFTEMPAAFAGYAADLVAPSVTVSVVHSGAHGSRGPLPAWTVDATVTIAGQDGSWVLPPGPPALRAGIPSLRRASTQDEGAVAVQWRPQAEATSSLVLAPRTQPPLGSEELLACTVRDAATGLARSVDAILGPDGWRLGTVGSAEVVTCTARTMVEAIPTPEPMPSPSAAPPPPPPPLPEPGRSPRPPAQTTPAPAAPPPQSPAATPTPARSPTASPTASPTPSPSPAPSSSPDPNPAGPETQAADGMPRTAFDPGPAPPPVTAGPLAVFDPAAQVRVTLDVVPGQVVGGQSVSTEASSLEPFSLVYGTVYSSPQRLFFEVADSSGTYQSSAGLPENLGAGPHVVIVEATSITGRSLSVAGGFALDDEGKVVAVAQPRALVEPIPADPRVLRALQYGRPAHDARADTLGTATAGVAAAVALGIGAAGAGGTVVRGRRKGSVKGLITKRIREVETVEPGPGDRSRTWRWPGTAWTDRFVRVLPTVGATRTSVVARLGQEGTWARVVFGSGGYLLWAAAAGLALLSSAEQQGLVVAPEMPVLLALVVIGVLDASAGTVGWAVLVATSLVSGNIATADDVRTLLGIGSLLVWPVLLSNAIRPLRRPDWWTEQSGRLERLIDYVVRVADHHLEAYWGRACLGRTRRTDHRSNRALRR